MTVPTVGFLQVSSSGASNQLTIMDAPYPVGTQSSGGAYQNATYYLGMISNADSGVVLTWSVTFPSYYLFNTQYGMAITTGTGVSIVGGNASGNGSARIPIDTRTFGPTSRMGIRGLPATDCGEHLVPRPQSLTTWLSTDCKCTPGNPAASSCTANTAPW